MLKDPPITVNVFDEARVNHEMTVELAFVNPVSEILRDCSLTPSGTGLLQWEELTKLPDLMPNNRVCVKLIIVPHKSGERTLLVGFDRASFKDIKTSCIVNVKP
ncbi:hypothetical protein CHARACLAT_029705 [Characodon lateralis]|uniref:Transglutaminase C-terminal domain-containing protein n=1 Tax=Characodon lateralis TaxID=208331 RepID=A0ABU7DWV4_9TELE|nr:hypothetical protein [Characodon lateralis]